MHGRSFTTRCLRWDSETSTWCHIRPSSGVFCAQHAHEFRCDELAKAATRLVRARRLLNDPSTSPLRQWWALLQVRRLQGLRRQLERAIARYEGPGADVVLSMEGPLPVHDPDRRR